MKKSAFHHYHLTFLTFLHLLFSSTQAFTQEQNENMNPFPSTNEERGAVINVRTNPFFLLMKGFDVTTDFYLTPTMTLGTTASYADLRGDNQYLCDLKFWSAGVVAHKFFAESSKDDAWYISAGAKYNSYSMTGEKERPREENLFRFEKAKGSFMTIETGAGYQWMWDHFNIRLGGKIAVHTAQYVSNRINPGLDFSIGWAL